MQSTGCQEVYKTLNVMGETYGYYALPDVSKLGIQGTDKLPFTLKILLENLLRSLDGRTVSMNDLKSLQAWIELRRSDREIAFRPARVLMQDFTGVPAVVDLAAMRDAMVQLGGDPERINPLTPVDLVIDHSVMVDWYGNNQAFSKNEQIEYQRNKERYTFLRWGQQAFDNFRVVPPGTGICHQVNLEYLAQSVWVGQDKKTGQLLAYPDTVVGTDSHTTMVNSLAVLGWGVGGIEAEAVMLGQPVSMLIPEVVGFKLSGKLAEGATATDLVLTVTQMLRAKGVVGKFVEFYGEGLDHLSLADRATIANMAPEYGATCGFFPVDQETLRYLRFTGRDEKRVQLVEKYCKEQGLWRDPSSEPIFSDTLEVNLHEIEPSMAGPKRPQDRVVLGQVKSNFETLVPAMGGSVGRQISVSKHGYSLEDGHVVIAAITSCTNTSNPNVMVAAGLLARKAVQKGLRCQPWVKTSLAPGSQVVTDYLERSGLQSDLDQLGFNLVGYGCTTCIGNSGPLDPDLSETIEKNQVIAAAVLSGNRNFEGRIHPLVKANYLASPPLVVAYALAGSVMKDLNREPLGLDSNQNPVYLRDIWPTSQEIQETIQHCLTPDMFKNRYARVFEGNATWQNLQVSKSMTYGWDHHSTYVKNPPYFHDMGRESRSLHNIDGARILALLGDSITTDHISPAGSIKPQSPAGQYLIQHGVEPVDFNSYGARRGNDQVMIRGTFANIRLRNEMLDGIEGGMTRHYPSGEVLPIFDAAMKYKQSQTPLVVFAGLEYGTGSSRDWAAKGTMLLGVKAVVAESFERIHRSNLIGMGVLPLQFESGVTRKTLGLKGDEVISLFGVDENIQPKSKIKCQIQRTDGTKQIIDLTCRIDTLDELYYYKNQGILQYVLRGLLDVA